MRGPIGETVVCTVDHRNETVAFRQGDGTYEVLTFLSFRRRFGFYPFQIKEGGELKIPAMRGNPVFDGEAPTKLVTKHKEQVMAIISWEKVEPTTETLIDIVIYRLNIFNFYFAYGFVRCAFKGFGLEVSNGGIWGFKYPYVFRVLFWDKSHYLNFGFAEAPTKE